ncbi:hypothetical protein F442_03094 [Phytophthora nicotianae P10297]|uniref:Uncharacterized protein n=3 Tax=Phytophthora nicotianae TaxID=4792 RepID=V9FRE5_PHYNI|nr:hypothetical protein F443_03111 [Phytophthora nicotianae P1569]ETO76452.1 hypothetical protein F444_08152 [Phytophthora nicotianae P1976]ETP51822.1 hypothetical protein F442_03094 [Phytophthora nicotianae P10297]
MVSGTKVTRRKDEQRERHDSHRERVGRAVHEKVVFKQL